MGTATATTRICVCCKRRKLIGVEILAISNRCRLCARQGIQKPKETPKLRPEAFFIVEAEKADGFFHVARKVNRKSVCLKPFIELHDGFRQGTEALRLLSRDPGACPRCREFLQSAMFGENK